jgi:hypothetical protein
MRWQDTNNDHDDDDNNNDNNNNNNKHILLIICIYVKCKKKKNNSGALVREQTILAERPPLVGEVSANFCGYRVPCCQRDGLTCNLSMHIFKCADDHADSPVSLLSLGVCLHLWNLTTNWLSLNVILDNFTNKQSSFQFSFGSDNFNDYFK